MLRLPFFNEACSKKENLFFNRLNQTHFTFAHYSNIWLGFATEEFSSFQKFFTFATSSEKGNNVDSKQMYNSLETALFDTIALSKDLYTNSKTISNFNLLAFNPVFSLSRSYGRNLYNTHQNISAIFTQQAVLSEILTIREYLLRELYKQKLQRNVIPAKFVNTPSNILFTDLVFLFNYYNLVKILNDKQYIDLYDLSQLIDNLYNSFTDSTKCELLIYINEYVKYKMYLNLNPICLHNANLAIMPEIPL